MRVRRSDLFARPSLGPVPIYGAEPNCKGGLWAWVPVVGCDWKAGAREASAQAQATAGDWMTGVKYLINTGKQEGLYAALQEYSQGAIYAAAVVTEWTAQEVRDVLSEVDERVAAYRGKRAESDALLAQLQGTDPAAASALEAQFRGAAYQRTLEGVEAGLLELRDASSGAEAWAQGLQEQVTFGFAQGAAAATIPVGAYATAVAICLTMIAALWVLQAAEQDLSVAVTGALEAMGWVPEGTTDAMLKVHDRPHPGDKLAGAIPWIVGGIALVVFAPVVWQGVAAWRMKRQLAGRAQLRANIDDDIYRSEAM